MCESSQGPTGVDGLNDVSWYSVFLADGLVKMEDAHVKKSMWTGYLWELSPEEAVRTFAERGWRYLELSEEEAADDCGVSVLQGHFIMTDHGWDGEKAVENVVMDTASDDPAEQEYVFEIMKRWVDLFAAIGIEKGVWHSGGHSLAERGVAREEVRKRQEEAFAKVSAFAEGKVTRIAIENLSVDERVDVADIMDLVACVDGSDAGICLDTGHAFMSGLDVAEFVREAGDRLIGTHVTDCVSKKRDHFMPFSSGLIDWPPVMRALAEIGYEGLFNFEIPRENRCPMPVRLAKLDYLSEVADYMIGTLAGGGGESP